MRSERVKAHPEIAQHLATAFVRTLQWINTPHAGGDRRDGAAGFHGQGPCGVSQGAEGGNPDVQDRRTHAAGGAEFEWRVLAEANPKYKSVRVPETYTNRFVDVALEARHAK